MAITAQDVNKLRQMTGAGMMDCKKALSEANGDFEAAIDLLRKKGQKVSASRADRSTSEGAVFVKTTPDNKEGFLIALNCETDFVAKNEEFVSMAKAILEKAIEKKPASAEELTKLDLDGRAIADHLTDMMGKIGEKIEVSAYEHIKAEKVISYIHGAKIGVLVGLKGTGNNTEADGAGKDIAMQIAAMRPLALDKDGIDPTLIEREIEIVLCQARAEGKAENMLEKIVVGKLNKFYKDNTLLNQEFIKDPKVSVSQYLNNIQKGLTVSDFKRVGIGA